MKNQRSPLEDLNAQRTRRASSPLDGLNRTLEELESRLKGLDTVRAPAERSYYPDEDSFFPRPLRSDLHDEIAELKRTVQTLAREESLRRLNHRWDSLDERFDAFEQRQGTSGDLNAPAFMRQMDERLDEISRAILSSGMSRRPDPSEARRLERIEEHLADLTRQIEAAEERSALPDPTFIREIDRRFEELAQRLDEHYTGSIHDARLIESLEGRLEDISQQLSVNAAAQSAMHTSFPGHEVFRNLEAQVAEIARHLAKPDPRMPVLEQRLDSIERSLKSSRDTMLDAARQAAEDAIRHVVKNGSPDDAAIARQLAQDLKSLEALTRRTDERSSRTFETIHDTLIKIVDRLGRLEEEAAKPGSTPIELPKKSTASLPFESESPAMSRSPAAAAAEAALAALKSDGRAAPKASEREGRKSMFGGLAKAVKGRGNNDAKAEAAVRAQKAEPGFASMAKMDAIAEPLDEADIKLANQPLEPGSGMPDLNTILKRVRDERRERGGEAPADAGKADYIIAARRAAQAAAAESERLKKTAEKPRAKKRPAGGGSVLQRQRKPVLMAIAAIMIAMAGLQVGTAFLARDDQQGEFGDAANLTEAPTAAPSLDTRSTAAVPEKQPDAKPQAVTPEAPAEQPAPPPPADTVMLHTRAATATPEPAPQTEASAPAPTQTSTPAQAETETQQVSIPEIPAEAGPEALRAAAAQGDPKALFEIGNRYTDGRGVQSDYAKAAQWYELAAAKGFAPAQYRLGNLNEKGLGMPRDTAKAKKWYSQAAEQGNASAMHNLAVLYAMGPDGTPDNNAAARWFIKAAEHGVKDSQFNLGILAAKGLGLPQNLEESYKWFALAAQSGDKDAEQKRDAIAGSLKPEQLERAKGMVSLWKAKPLNEAANSVEVPDAWLESQPMTTGAVDMKKAVRNIQLILSRSGYDAGTPDGVMGAKTRQAIAAFQKANGMKPTGDVDQPLVEALLKQNQQLSMAAKQ